MPYADVPNAGGWVLGMRYVRAVKCFIIVLTREQSEWHTDDAIAKKTKMVLNKPFRNEWHFGTATVFGCKYIYSKNVPSLNSAYGSIIQLHTVRALLLVTPITDFHTKRLSALNHSTVREAKVIVRAE